MSLLRLSQEQRRATSGGVVISGDGTRRVHLSGDGWRELRVEAGRRLRLLDSAGLDVDLGAIESEDQAVVARVITSISDALSYLDVAIDVAAIEAEVVENIEAEAEARARVEAEREALKAAP